MKTRTSTRRSAAMLFALSSAIAFAACSEDHSASEKTAGADEPEAETETAETTPDDARAPSNDDSADDDSGAEFTPVEIDAEAFVIALLHEEAGEDTREFVHGEEPNQETLHIDKEPILDGRDIIGVQFGRRPAVSFHVRLTEEASENFARQTEENTNRLVVILINGEIDAITMIPSRIETRNLQLPGVTTEDEAETIIQAWTNGATP